MDTGYLNAELLAESKKSYGVDLCGPTRLNHKWQVREKSGLKKATKPVLGLLPQVQAGKLKHNLAGFL